MFHRRPPFDPSATYRATRPFLYDGAEIDSGSVLPPDVPLRNLRQLYGAHWVEIAPAENASTDHSEAKPDGKKRK